MAINRTDLIIEIARRSKTTRRQMTRDEVQHVVDIMLDIVEDQLTRPDGGIRLPGLGLLGVHERRVKRGANQGTLIHPETGHEIDQSRSHYRITFKPTRDLRDKLRERLPTYRYEDHD